MVTLDDSRMLVEVPLAVHRAPDNNSIERQEIMRTEGARREFAYSPSENFIPIR